MLRRDEHGAVIIITAISMLMILSAVALAVDIGDLVWRKRQIQGVVDLASLDAVRALSDQRDASQDRCAQAVTLAQQSASRNNFDYSASGFSLSVQLGTVDPTTKAWSMLTDCVPNAVGSAAANAVKVIASRPVLFSWLPGSDNVLGTGIATTNAKADIAMGTWLAKFSTSNSTPLDKLLFCMGTGGGTCSSGTGVTALGYGGLVGATINYGDLFTQLNLGTTTQLANTQITYKSMLLAAASVMTAKGDVASASALNTLALSANSTPTFKFGDFLDLSSGYGSVAAVNTNLLDLIGATGEVANPSNFIEVDNLGIAVPGVSTVNMKLSVIEAPKHAYGPVGTSVHTAQVRAEFDLNLIQTVKLCLVLACVNVPLTLKLYVESAAGDGTLTNIFCGNPNTSSTATVHVTTSAVTIYVGEVTPNSAFTNTQSPPTVKPNTLADTSVSVAGLGLVHVTIGASGSLPVSGFDGSVTMGPGNYTRNNSVGSAGVTTDSLANNLNITTSLGGLSISGGSILSILTPVLQAADTSLLNIVSTLPLGIQFAGADLWNSQIDCGGRKLVG